MTPSLSSAVTDEEDKGGGTEWPLGSLGSDLCGYTSRNTGADTSPTDGAVRSTAEEAVESMVDATMVAASWSGVSWTLV